MECRQFGLNARQRYEERFAPEINRARLLEVFDAVCDTPAARQRRVA